MNNRLVIFKSLNLSEFEANLSKDREIVAAWGYDGVLKLVPNISTQLSNFALDRETKRQIIDGEVIGILHSHLHSMLPDLSRFDIDFADYFEVDIASYHVDIGMVDYFSPFLHHPYPLLADLTKFQDRRYEIYRSDCYRFIDNCLRYVGYQLPLICKTPEMYLYTENFDLQRYADKAGWKRLYCATTHLINGDLLIFKFDTESHHFGLYINGLALVYGLKGIKCINQRMINKYVTHGYRLLNPLTQEQQKQLGDIIRDLNQANPDKFGY